MADVSRQCSSSYSRRRLSGWNVYSILLFDYVFDFAFVLLYRYGYLFWKGQFAAVLPDGLFLRLDKPEVENRRVGKYFAGVAKIFACGSRHLYEKRKTRTRYCWDVS